jgi:RNA polymerase-associated protein RTF1
MIARKNALSGPARGHRSAKFTEKIRLKQELKLAYERQDQVEASAIEAQLRVIEEEEASSAPSTPRAMDTNDLMAKVNEKNRARTLELIRKAESESLMRKRMERKAMLLAQQGGGSGASTPGGSFDPSARLKTVPKVFKDRSRCVRSPPSLLFSPSWRTRR